MRLSVDKDDPGYSPDAFKAKVTLDGVELRNCVTADEEQGVAICYIDKPFRGDTVPRETRSGVVKIIMPDGEAH
jgi:hypothetical protein